MPAESGRIPSHLGQRSGATVPIGLGAYQPLTTVFQSGLAASVGSYRESEPHPALRRYVLRYWTWERSASTPYDMTVLPDGCIDLIVADGVASLAGVIDASFHLHAARAHHWFGARFLPGGAYHFLRESVAGLRNRFVALDERIDDLAALERLLLQRFARATEAKRPSAYALSRLIATRGTLPVTTIAEQAGVCRRQLQRDLQRWTGLPPKLLARILRLQAAIAAPGLDWGYADEAHLCHEAKALTGLTRSQIYKAAAAR